MSTQMVIFPGLPAPLETPEHSRQRWKQALTDVARQLRSLQCEARERGYNADAARLDFILEFFDVEGP